MKAECEHGLDTRLPCGDCQKAYEAENAPSLDSSPPNHACDYREQKFAEIAAENMTLCKQLQYANGKLSEAMLLMDELRTMLCKPND